MTSIKQVSQAMRRILSEKADQAVRLTGFVPRESKMGGAAFVQTQATLGKLAQTAANAGVPITLQGLDQRFA